MVLGSWNPKSTICPFRARKWPFQPSKTLRFKGKIANFGAKNTVKQGKNTKRTNSTHFTRVQGGLPTGWPGVSRPVVRGQKFMCCARNPSNINIFVRVPGQEDWAPGRIQFGDRGDREIVHVPKVYVPFPAP